MELQSRPEALAVELARHQVDGGGPGPGRGLRGPEPGVLLLVAGSARLEVPGGSLSSEPAPRVGKWAQAGPLPGRPSARLSRKPSQLAFFGGGVGAGGTRARRLLAPHGVCTLRVPGGGPAGAGPRLCARVRADPPGPHLSAILHSLQK